MTSHLHVMSPRRTDGLSEFPVVDFPFYQVFINVLSSQTILSLSEFFPLSFHQHATFICSHGIMIWLTLRRLFHLLQAVVLFYVLDVGLVDI